MKAVVRKLGFLVTQFLPPHSPVKASTKISRTMPGHSAPCLMSGSSSLAALSYSGPDQHRLSRRHWFESHLAERLVEAGKHVAVIPLGAGFIEVALGQNVGLEQVVE